jgi:hypothetical protein
MKKTVYSRLVRLCLSAILLSVCSLYSGAQGTLIKNGTTLKVASGTIFTETVKLSLESGSAVDNAGTIVLKGDLVDNNSSATNLGNGTFVFSGTSAQNISGLNILNNVTLNNSAGLIIGGNTQVNGTFTMTLGNVTLGANNLLMGPSASFSGTPDNTHMIVATGAGQLQKQFTDGSGARSFTFPVGDGSGAGHYTPVALSFTSGTYSTGIAGVNLNNVKYTDPNITVDYLNRYWNITGSGITSYAYNAQFNYIGGALPGAEDVTGTENLLYCTKVAPVLESFDAANTTSHYLTASGSTTFGTFTGAKTALQAGLNAYMDGPYNSVSGLMNTTLNTLGFIPLAQPYNTAPWNYTGLESVGAIPAGVVDWVLVEFRQAATPALASSATALAKRAVFLKNDGTLIDLDGSPSIKFYNALGITTNVYAVVHHRNHLSIMTNSAVGKTAGAYVYDFTTSSNQIYDGTGGGCIQLGSKWGMIGGNAYGDNIVNITDFTLWQTNFMQTNYNPGDFNLSGQDNITDFTVWQNRFMQTSKVPN